MKAPRGQNFLYQPAWQRRVAEAVGAAADLVEIGGGPGDLSALLARQAKRFWVIESDAGLAQGLRRRFADQPNVEVIEADVLTLDWSSLAPGRGLRVAGNLPYYITSPILLHLFASVESIADATIMVQREVAQRILAQPGGRDFGLLSATVQLFGRPEWLLDLPPGAFRPPPQVHSSLIRISMAPCEQALGVKREPFLRFLRLAFAQKRKQLGKRLGLPITARAEQLSLPQLAEVYHRWLQLPGSTPTPAN